MKVITIPLPDGDVATIEYWDQEVTIKYVPVPDPLPVEGLPVYKNLRYGQFIIGELLRRRIGGNPWISRR